MVLRGRREEVIPSAGRLMSSLRDLGYDFGNAVADLIDNSVSARATRVDVTIAADGPDSWVRIADNGRGMPASAMTEAMRLGSGGGQYDQDNLGKFGLGLKTASLSQARSITVASRSNPTRRLIDCRQLDLDEITATDRWEIVHPSAADRPQSILDPLEDTTGTVVLWTKLDRILSLSDPFGGWVDRHLFKLADSLDLHLGMVFGRFLSRQARRPEPLTITINGTKVEPWDPFCLTEDVQVLPEKQLRVGTSMVRYRPYVLPPQRDFRDDDAWRRAGGPNQWNRQQGLYIYRGDRMIQSGGWSWLRGIDEHIKLGRAAVEFWPELDEQFEINISKMRVKLPEDLRDQLKPLVGFLSSCADERYRKNSRRANPPAAPTPPRKLPVSAPPPTPQTGASVHAPGEVASDDRSPTSTPGQGGAGSTVTASSGDTATHGEVSTSGSGGAGSVSAAGPAKRRAALEEAAARAGAMDVLDRIRTEMYRIDPEVARDLGW